MRRETWLEELAVELAARGVARGAAAEIVVEADGHLRETAAAPLETFESPATYATALVDALAPTVLRTQEGGLIDQLRPAEHFVLFGRGRGLSRAQAVQDGRRLAEQLGWDALRAPVAGELSGGTRQKLNIAYFALIALDRPVGRMLGTGAMLVVTATTAVTVAWTPRRAAAARRAPRVPPS